MHTSFEEQVRERAYQIWLAAGMAEGLAHEHWVSAERAVANECAMPANGSAETSAARIMTKTVPSATTKSARARKSETKRSDAKTSKAAKAKH